MSITITKADGTTEAFKPKKLKQSLHRAGATKEEVRNILRKIEKDLYDGIKTQAIYRKAFTYLRTSEAPLAARYSLRRALFGLGPTGFPFEDFLARVFQANGYKTKTRLILKGKCVEHEIDVVSRSTSGNRTFDTEDFSRDNFRFHAIFT